ncbi:MAG: adenylate/guanylate cyclase domain-containing protein, partial [Polyangiaceae bacterium]
HCILELRDGQFLLRDLGSLNGTFVNGERVRGEQFLRHGDEIALGSTRARYDDGSGVLNMPPLAMSPGAVLQPHNLPQNNPPSSSWQQPSQQQPQQQPQPSSMQGGYAPQSAMRSQYGSAPQHAQQAQIATAQPHASPYAQQSKAPAYPTPAMAPPQPHMPNPNIGRRPPSFGGTRVDVLESARAIGTQIAAQTKGFLPFDQISQDPQQMRLDYERLRLTWELSRDIALERDLDKLLEKILLSLFKFVNADRGVILLKDEKGELQPRAARRRDGTDAPIQVSSTILSHVIKEQKSVITHDASMDFAASKGKSMILNRISSALVVPLLHEKEVLGALWLDSESLAVFQQKDLEMITAVANQAAMFIENNLLAKKIEQEIITRERFSRLLSPNLAEQVASGKLEVKKGGQLVAECTVFNSDIRGFTRMSEGTTAEVMVEILNEYFEEMVAAIFKYEGTLDKFMGDGIMAIWGAPAVHADDPIRCVQSALDQMEMLGKFNRKRMDGDLPPLAIGIGIHTGPLVAGYVGSSKSLSYTVIGDTANTSARLCGIAAPGQIIVSESTLARLGNRFEYEELPAASLKGKEKPLRIYNVKREKPSAASAVG